MPYKGSNRLLGHPTQVWIQPASKMCSLVKVCASTREKPGPSTEAVHHGRCIKHHVHRFLNWIWWLGGKQRQIDSKCWTKSVRKTCRPCVALHVFLVNTCLYFTTSNLSFCPTWLIQMEEIFNSRNVVNSWLMWITDRWDEVQLL